MTDAIRAWRPCNDVAWVGDGERVIAARTSPPDADGPRILEGAAAQVWLLLAECHSGDRRSDLSDAAELIERALAALAAAGVIEPA